MKRIFLLFIVLMITSLLIGCGGSSSESNNIRVIKNGDTFKYENKAGDFTYTVGLETYATDDPLYRVIFCNMDVKFRPIAYEPAYVQNILTGDLYFAEVEKSGDIYLIRGDKYEAFLNDMPFGYKKVYTNIIYGDVTGLTVEVGTSTKSVTTVNGKKYIVYPVTYTWVSSEDTFAETYYWAKGLGWYFDESAFEKID